MRKLLIFGIILFLCTPVGADRIDVTGGGGGAGGAPTDADYLVGTANGSLSAEIVVGTTPGGELGGTWASPTVDDLFVLNSTADSMTGQLTITEAGNALDIQNTTDATPNQVAIFKSGNRATPANSDAGYFSFFSDDDTGTQVEFARFIWYALDVTNDTKDSALRFDIMRNNSLIELLYLSTNSFVINNAANDVNFCLEGVNDTNLLFGDAGEDTITIGSNTSLGKFGIDGDADEIQLIVQGNATQNTSLIVAENSAGTDQMTLSNAGVLNVVGSITEGGNAVYSSGETPSGSLGGTYANITIDDLFLKLGGDVASAGTYDFGSASVILELPNSTADTALSNAGEINLNATDDQIGIHGGATGEVQGEAAISLLRHITLTFDPAGYYDQETTYRVIPVMYVGDDCPEGFTITEWKVNYVAGDPTTELDMDLCFDTTPDFNPAAGMTVMDVLDTTAGASSADTGFDSATASNGSRMYLRLGADPTDANVVITVDIWGYNEED